MFEINLPSDMFDNIKNHIAGTLFIARLKGNDGKSFTLVFEPAAEQSFAPDVAKYCPQCGNKYDGVLCGECGFTTSPRR